MGLTARDYAAAQQHATMQLLASGHTVKSICLFCKPYQLKPQAWQRVLQHGGQLYLFFSFISTYVNIFEWYGSSWLGTNNKKIGFWTCFFYTTWTAVGTKLFCQHCVNLDFRLIRNGVFSNICSNIKNVFLPTLS